MLSDLSEMVRCFCDEFVDDESKNCLRRLDSQVPIGTQSAMQRRLHKRDSRLPPRVRATTTTAPK
jgi:hypothetical protein